ncbi:MAG TPA: heat-inducible transcriptional repressor HrcA [Candidatus Acidoferrales bacterium]|jgi:heat-inducible transcriptional repressor|nr:heat-inducible transcriptional repressor HrcA [Candidatus Acidoferrales bacterium]
MKTDSPLKSRHSEILSSIVRAYIETGEPVGSRTISKGRNNTLSPASIRNVMADLADEGYLSQPHTSAGRVPTEKAFRYYASTVTVNRIAAGESDRLSNEFNGLDTVGARVERSSFILMELTHHVGIAAAMPALAQELDQIELVPLAANRLLMIVVTRDRMVRNRVVALDEPVSPEELVSVRNYVNHNFRGWQLGHARRELLRRLEEERERYHAVLRKLQLLYSKGLLEADTSPEVHMEGASNLLGLDLHLTREKMRELFHALEEKQRLIELLDRFLEQPLGELEVHVGLEQAHPAMKGLALIGMTVRMASGLPGKVAVLGPMRMNYDRAIAAVLQTGRALENSQF